MKSALNKMANVQIRVSGYGKLMSHYCDLRETRSAIVDVCLRSLKAAISNLSPAIVTDKARWKTVKKGG
jgi:hypothetical protein